MNEGEDSSKESKYIFGKTGEAELAKKLQDAIALIDPRKLAVGDKDVPITVDLFNISEQMKGVNGLTPAEFTKRKDRIRKSVFRYLRQFKDPGLAVEKANEIQAELPFVLFDPSMGIALPKGKKLKYTVADLVNFLGQFRPKGQVVQHDMDGHNPWFVKLQTPIIDFDFDQILKAAKDTLSYEADLDRMNSVMGIMQSLDGTSGLDPSHIMHIKRINYKQIIKKMIQILEKLTNPSFLSTLVTDIKGNKQNRPMYTYESENFDQIVGSFFLRYPLALGTNPYVDKKRRKHVPQQVSLLRKKHPKKQRSDELPEEVNIPFHFTESTLD